MKYIFLVVAFTLFFEVVGLGSVAQAVTPKVRTDLSKLKYFGVAKNQIPTDSTLARFEELARISQVSVLGPRLMANDDFNRGILVSLRRLNPEFEGVPLKHPDGISVQMKMGQEHVALFFIGFAEADVTKIVAEFGRLYEPARGPASEQVGGSGSGATASEVREVSYARELFNSFKGCGAGLIKGFNAVTVDPFISAGKSLKGLSEIGWARYWENSKREFDQTVSAVRNYEDTIARGVANYKGLSVEEKSSVNCSLVGGGGGTGLATKAAQKIASRTVVASSEVAVASSGGSAARPAASTESVYVQAARRSANERAAARNAAVVERVDDVGDAIPFSETHVRPTSVEGMVVKEWNPVPASKDVIPVSIEDYIKINGNFDPTKVRKAPEPPKRREVAASAIENQWFRAVIDVGNGNFSPINYKVLKKKPSGKLLIEFENPLHRGRLEQREMRPGELSRGHRAIDPPLAKPPEGAGL